MDLTTLFGKLQEHELEPKRLVDDEEGEKKNKIVALKIEEENDSGSDDEMTMIIQNLKRFMKCENLQKE